MKPLYQKSVLEINDIEQPARIYAISRGWLFEKVVSQSRKGWPDRLAIRNGRVVFVEFKKPGEEPTAQQYKRHQEIRDHGGEVVWFNTLEAAKAFFK